jgi:hypothetical protein
MNDLRRIFEHMDNESEGNRSHEVDIEIQEMNLETSLNYVFSFLTPKGRYADL